MRCGGLYFVCLALCCLHTESEPLRFPEDQINVRRRRSDEKDGLALSREIFKNITKHLRENIRREGPTDKSDNMLQFIHNDDKTSSHPGKYSTSPTIFVENIRHGGATDKNDHLLLTKVEESRQYVPYQGYHHHEHHWGPYFEEEKVTQVAAHVGAEALLNCRVSMLKDKTVMWLRNTTDSAHLLTVGPEKHSGDSRIAVKFQYPNNWRLSMSPARGSDSGLYMCQISTHPPRTIFANLTILPPLITINGDQTHEVKDRFYKAGSSIKLSCIISDEYISSVPTKAPTTTMAPTTVTTPRTTTTEMTTKMSTVFNRIDVLLNKSWSVETTTITSTVSISTTTKKAPDLKTTTVMTTTVEPSTPPVVNNVYGLSWKKLGKDFFDNITWRNVSATISVASASQNDSGTYTCHLQNHSQVTINVHVLIGENQAAVHHDTWNKGSLFWQPQYITLFPLIAIFLFFT